MQLMRQHILVFVNLLLFALTQSLNTLKYPKQTTSSGTGSQHGTKTTDSSRSVYEKLTTLQKTMVKDACKERCEGYLLCSIVDNGRSYKECVEKCIRERYSRSRGPVDLFEQSLNRLNENIPIRQDDVSMRH
ncbi:hypothetical protein D918_04464 [Trichuris suis]|nr:hypothetical protein D918_04464 [Trichuris suis]